MRYRPLKIALFAEGPSDGYFLCPLIRRVAQDLCASAPALIEVSDVFQVWGQGQTREEKIRHVARTGATEIDVLVVHADGGGKPDRARKEQVEPGCTSARALGVASVGLVPIREMEAWCLVDGGAIRQAFGTSLSDEELGAPSTPADVEGIGDPKAALAAAWRKTSAPRRARANPVDTFLVRIGEHLSIQRLRRVPAYRAFEEELTDALRERGYVR